MTFIIYNYDDPEYKKNEFDEQWFNYMWKFNICFLVYNYFLS
jgi:hypothetical protein